MPTFADMLNVDLHEYTDGISFLPTLLNQGTQGEHDHLYWEFHELNGRQAIRKDRWKLIKYNVHKEEKYQLYDLETDPSESKNLASEQPGLVDKLSRILESARTDSEEFKW